MVGIPGKSKGCHTCRRRKIKLIIVLQCDLEEPNCNRCRQSGRECEGYKRGAVFLNRTAQGLEKRKRLEEAQPRQDTSPITVSPQSDVKSHSTTPIIEDTNPDWKTGGSTYPVQPVVVHVNTQSVMKKKLQGVFLETYLPANPNDGTALYREWLCEVVNLNNPGKLLEYSLHALCITRAGRLDNNQALVFQGSAAYGFALRELQKALLSPRLATKDETLAACYLLSMYELFETTSQSITGHDNHLLGVERLVAFRGPKQHETQLGSALFKNICYSSMVKCIQYRKKSLLKDMIDQIEWRQRDMILFSKGHTLGALLQDLDLYAASGPANINIFGLSQLLGRLLALDVELQIWYRQLLEESPSSLYWPTMSEEEEEDSGAISFATLEIAHLMLDYWALRLILSVTIATLCAQIPLPDYPAKNGSQSPADSTQSDRDEVPVQHGDVVSFIQQAKAEHSGHRQLELAINIMESLPFCMDTENGISSSQKCLFGARVAMYLLERYPPARFSTYQALYNGLSSNKGLGFAKSVGSTLQRWEKQV
ncbi:Aspercryptin biosynthesis cluster-specific transcription regulator atnN [Hyphodiscus hymeniophilus]|uniref:Aspercryptin biosynthesis cluster-specific transcription regulator atnN n=1 Tax=Hyphodiscus hymeniophilus TaxID=353542 RepID=A0A9P7AZV7_9HELO|nr:Aspercryptin biosynthesis cluster-specific transcription regulator atnN [Hyphodiscus hymeniophilus]